MANLPRHLGGVPTYDVGFQKPAICEEIPPTPIISSCGELAGVQSRLRVDVVYADPFWGNAQCDKCTLAPGPVAFNFPPVISTPKPGTTRYVWSIQDGCIGWSMTLHCPGGAIEGYPHILAAVTNKEVGSPFVSGEVDWSDGAASDGEELILELPYILPQVNIAQAGRCSTTGGPIGDSTATFYLVP